MGNDGASMVCAKNCFLIDLREGGKKTDFEAKWRNPRRVSTSTATNLFIDILVKLV